MANENRRERQDPASERFRIGDLLLDTGKLDVTRDGEVLDISGLSLDLLLALARHAPNVVSHDTLVDEVWTGRVISPETITQRVKLLRRALGDDAEQPTYIGLVRNRGYRLLVDVERLGEQPRNSAPGSFVEAGRRRVPAVAPVYAAIALALLVGATVALFYLIYPNVVDPTTASAQRPAIIPNSIVVLPFSDLSPDGDHAYFAEGIAEELLNQLSALDGIAVFGRAQSFQYRNTGLSPVDFARRLGAAHVLNGSVRNQADDLRISVDLLDTESGLSIWSQQYDRKLLDVFAIQEDIAVSVATAFSIAAEVDGRKMLPGAGTDSLEAYDALLAGRALSRVGRGPEGIPHYERALEQDPEYAQAWVAIAFAKGLSSWEYPPVQAKVLHAEAMALLEHAIELNPDLAEVWFTVAAFRRANHDFVGAAEALETGRRLAPGALQSESQDVALLARTGRIQEALAIRESRRKGEINYYRSQGLAESLIQAGRYDDAREALGRSAAINPAVSPSVILRRFFIALSERDHDAAGRYLEELAAANPDVRNVSRPVLDAFGAPDDQVIEVLREVFGDADNMTPEGRILTASLAAYFGDPALALEALWAEMQHNSIRVGRLWYPFFSNVRKLPEFKQMVDDLGLLTYWRRYGWADFCRPIAGGDFECW